VISVKIITLTHQSSFFTKSKGHGRRSAVDRGHVPPFLKWGDIRFSHSFFRGVLVLALCSAFNTAISLTDAFHCMQSKVIMIYDNDVNACDIPLVKLCSMLYSTDTYNRNRLTIITHINTSLNKLNAHKLYKDTRKCLHDVKQCKACKLNCTLIVWRLTL